MLKWQGLHLVDISACNFHQQNSIDRITGNDRILFFILTTEFKGLHYADIRLSFKSLKEVSLATLLLTHLVTLTSIHPAEREKTV